MFRQSVACRCKALTVRCMRIFADNYSMTNLLRSREYVAHELHGFSRMILKLRAIDTDSRPGVAGVSTHVCSIEIGDDQRAGIFIWPYVARNRLCNVAFAVTSLFHSLSFRHVRHRSHDRDIATGSCSADLFHKLHHSAGSIFAPWGQSVLGRSARPRTHNDQLHFRLQRQGIVFVRGSEAGCTLSEGKIDESDAGNKDPIV